MNNLIISVALENVVLMNIFTLDQEKELPKLQLFSTNFAESKPVAYWTKKGVHGDTL